MYQEPLPKNTTLGSAATFACNVSGNTGISWLVDGLSHHEVIIQERGISSQSHYNEASDSTKSVLTVPCDKQNNNTMLQCVGYSSGQFVKSNQVLLRIQGYSHLYQWLSRSFLFLLLLFFSFTLCMYFNYTYHVFVMLCGDIKAF